MCGKSVAVGLVSQTLIQHEDKRGERCRGSGQVPTAPAPRSSAARTGGAGGGTATRSAAAKKSSSPASKGGVSVRRVEVDPDALRERQEKAEKLRQERAAAARERNEVNVSYFDEPGV